MRQFNCFVFGIIWTFGPILIASEKIDCIGLDPLNANVLEKLEDERFWTIKYVGSTKRMYPSGGNDQVALTKYTFRDNSYQYLSTETITEIAPSMMQHWRYIFHFHVDDKYAIFQSDPEANNKAGPAIFNDKFATSEREVPNPSPEVKFALIDIRRNGGILIFKSCIEDFAWVQVSQNLMKERYNKKEKEAQVKESKSHYSLFHKKKPQVIPKVDPLDAEIKSALEALGIEPENTISASGKNLPAYILG